MVVVSYSGKEINAKLVYYGAGLSGKTTNLEAIYEAVPETSRGKMVSMKTQSDRTLFFDLLPLDLGEIMGFKTRFLLYTVPGQVFYNATRKLVLKGADAVVFVADSGPDKMDENKESLGNLRTNLQEYGLKLDEIPWVLQYNKRDLPNAISLEQLNAELNPDGKVPYFESVAMKGTGVFETFRGVSHLLMQKITRELHRSPQASARAAREESAARAAKRPPGTRVEEPETPPARAAEPAAQAPDFLGTRDPFAAPAKPAPEPIVPAAPEPLGLSLDVERPALELGSARPAFGGSKSPIEEEDDALELDSESAVSTHAPRSNDEPGSRRPPARFEERTLTLGSADPAAAAPSSSKSATLAAEPALARQEISIPVRVPAGGSRQIVIRITLEAE